MKGSRPLGDRRRSATHRRGRRRRRRGRGRGGRRGRRGRLVDRKGISQREMLMVGGMQDGRHGLRGICRMLKGGRQVGGKGVRGSKCSLLLE